MTTHKNTSTNELAVTEASTLLPAALDQRTLEGLGVNAQDMARIREVAQKLDPNVVQTVSEFGRDIGGAKVDADDLLGSVTTGDLDEAGKKLSQVVHIARSINLKGASSLRSQVPVIGPLIDRFSLSTSKLRGQFESASVQIDTLVTEVEKTQNNLSRHNASLENMKTAVKQDYREMGIHIAAGKLRLAELSDELAHLRSTAQTPMEVQQVADLDAYISNLDKRIGDLTVSQHSTLQELPMMAVIQSNNTMLIDKFGTIREITVPAWRRQYRLALSLKQQENAVAMANDIDNATNELIKQNALLLKQNAISTAKANQRLVIDIETLKFAQDTLIGTVEEVIRIQQAGVVERQNAEKQIEGMRLKLQSRLTNRNSSAVH